MEYWGRQEVEQAAVSQPTEDAVSEGLGGGLRGRQRARCCLAREGASPSPTARDILSDLAEIEGAIPRIRKPADSEASARNGGSGWPGNSGRAICGGADRI